MQVSRSILFIVLINLIVALMEGIDPAESEMSKRSGRDANSRYQQLSTLRAFVEIRSGLICYLGWYQFRCIQPYDQVSTSPYCVTGKSEQCQGHQEQLQIQ